MLLCLICSWCRATSKSALKIMHCIVREFSIASRSSMSPIFTGSNISARINSNAILTNLVRNHLGRPSKNSIHAWSQLCKTNEKSRFFWKIDLRKFYTSENRSISIPVHFFKKLRICSPWPFRKNGLSMYMRNNYVDEVMSILKCTINEFCTKDRILRRNSVRNAYQMAERGRWRSIFA